jgi:archaellum biogenesis ATPase FlaH
MKLQKVSRKKASIKMFHQGPSGSGKTYSSLLLAYGLCNDWSKIAVIDSENHSSELYSHLGSYNVLQLSAPYTPEKYVQAMEACGQAGMQVIIIDSISHEWEYILEAHASLPGNSFNNWQKIGLRHKVVVGNEKCRVFGNQECRENGNINAQ